MFLHTSLFRIEYCISLSVSSQGVEWTMGDMCVCMFGHTIHCCIVQHYQYEEWEIVRACLPYVIIVFSIFARFSLPFFMISTDFIIDVFNILIF